LTLSLPIQYDRSIHAITRYDSSPKSLYVERGHIFPNAWRLGGVTALALLALTACASSHVVNGLYVDEARGFKIPMLRDGWRQFEAEGVDLAFRADPGGQVAALFVSCEGQQAVPLRILAKRLFFGIRAKQIMAQEPVSLNGMEVIHTVLEGRLRDAEVMVSSYVAKDSDCVYDLVYVAPPTVFQDRLPEFDRFVNGWVFTRKRGL